MKPEFENILDECIRRIEAGEELSACLADYPGFAEELKPLLSIAQDMYALPTPQGSTLAASAGQERMLDKFDTTYAEPTRTPLWQSWQLALTQLFLPITSIFYKENMMYRKSFITIALVLAILFAGTTMTAYASQGSLPGDALYGVKTSLEEIQVSTVWDSSGEAEKSIEFAERRVEEITELVSLSRYDDIPIGVARFEQHLQDALDALSVVAQNDPDLAQQLALILTHLLDEQYQTIAALLESYPEANLAVLEDALTAVSTGIDDAGSAIVGEDDNDNSNENDNANENGADDSNENDDANENDDDNGNDNDDANENDDDGSNENDDANENDADDGNENDANENDANTSNENDDANENDDDGGNENDDDGNENG